MFRLDGARDLIRYIANACSDWVIVSAINWSMVFINDPCLGDQRTCGRAACKDVTPKRPKVYQTIIELCEQRLFL